ncbi:mCG147290 [Mus musculus]|nr:mCG147290 [Mus musculus]
MERANEEESAGPLVKASYLLRHCQKIFFSFIWKKKVPMPINTELCILYNSDF